MRQRFQFWEFRSSAAGFIFGLAILSALWLLLTAVLAAGAVSHPGPEDPAGTPALVRIWNPQTGRLVVWMTPYQTALVLDRLGKEPARAPEIRGNEGVSIIWLRDFPAKGRIATENEPCWCGELFTRTEKPANLVRIAGRLFLIRAVYFGDERYRTLPRGSNDDTR